MNMRCAGIVILFLKIYKKMTLKSNQIKNKYWLKNWQMVQKSGISAQGMHVVNNLLKVATWQWNSKWSSISVSQVHYVALLKTMLHAVGQLTVWNKLDCRMERHLAVGTTGHTSRVREIEQWMECRSCQRSRHTDETSDKQMKGHCYWHQN